MKRLILILLALVIVVPSCTSSKPLVKKERVYQYKAVDKFGEIVPDLEDLQMVIVNEFNNDGYLTNTTTYDEYGDIIYKTVVTYDSYKSEGIKKTSIVPISYTDRSDTTEIFYNKNTKKWDVYRNGEVDSHNADRVIELDIATFKTDDIVECFIKNGETFAKNNNHNLSYSGKLTKFNEKGNWIEAFSVLTEKDYNEHTMTYYKREILEYWE